MGQHLRKQHRNAVTSIPYEKERYVYSPRGGFLVPALPVVAPPEFSGRPLTFLEFLFAEESGFFLELIFGASRTDASVVLKEFRKALDRHYFGYRSAKRRAPKYAGRLDENSSKTRGRLTEFARLAYRGNSDRYSPVYWKRITGLIWDAYRFFNATRLRADWIRQREEKRIVAIPLTRKQTAARVRAHRKRKRKMELESLKRGNK